MSDLAATARETRFHRAVEKVRDRRRFKQTPVPGGAANRVVPAETVGTMFPSQVKDVKRLEPVLKDGASNSKIGGDVLVGWLRGARIVTLTLEERATCPETCRLWQTCYGNSMPFTARWRHGPELEARIRREVPLLCARHGRVLVRLHVLGDFYSPGYVALWSGLLAANPGLHVFGFTAWHPKTEIGRAICAARAEHGRRFSVRHSGCLGRWGAATIDFPTERKTIGDGIVCPEQTSAMAGREDGRHCGNCGACWSTDRTVLFVEH